jgi:predicted metal-binding transcription factor (methanogenesis marker protein 9)
VIEVPDQRSERAGQMTQKEVVSRRRRIEHQSKVILSAPACVSILLECCKASFECNSLDYPLAMYSIGGAGS